ncbi:hypothetical protein HN954_01710 [bacterium]|jgi:hypothetical protein|nr:hypothetical protein [bacterium]MBT6832181.1 hypothetical protein [bacterium]MBT6996126.1 hypothetical protein [bacterium]MBT7772206.1 hypothetical protein [bacterium]
MDFFLANALEILYLSLSGGFLILVFFLVRFFIKITWTVRRINGWIEIFEELIEKPIQVLMKLHKVLGPVLRLFGKKKK